MRHRICLCAQVSRVIKTQMFLHRFEKRLYQHGPQKKRSLKFRGEETNRSPVKEMVYIKMHEQLATIAGAANEDDVQCN